MTTKNQKNTNTGKKNITVTKGENKKIVAPVKGTRGRKPMSEEEKAIARENRAKNIAKFLPAAISAMAEELGLETLPQKFIEKHQDEINAEALKLYRASKGTAKKSGNRGVGSLTAKFIAKRWAANQKKKNPLTIEEFVSKITEAINAFKSEINGENLPDTGVKDSSGDTLEEIEA